MRLEIPYDHTTLEFEIPERNLLAIVKPTLTEAAASCHLEPGTAIVDREKQVVVDALLQPIGSPRLSQLIKSARKVAIVVSDITRPCPTYKFLPFLLDELRPIDLREVVIIFGLGIHRGHSREEQRQLIGERLFDQVQTIDFDPANCQLLGHTSRGTPIEVFRPFLEADLRICTGNIEYHYFAGYSGGLKAVMPGICSHRAIEKNHGLMFTPHAEAGVYAGNPVREDIEEVGCAVGVQFLFNVILNDKKEIIAAVAGDSQAAFRSGITIYDQLFGFSIDQPVDIVITSPGGYPKDLNLYQAQKAIDNAKGILRKDGALILVASCHEGFGEGTFEQWILETHDPDQLISRIQEKFVLGGHKAAAIASLRKKFDLYLVSDLPADLVRRIGFMPAVSIGEALHTALHKLGSESKVAVIPHGHVVKLSSQHNHHE
ncbi:MAG: nickel-dependent lactate racemase [Coprothermobacterota bacterium]|nr:nickel-dependent lactate racemase [Coprothermobacterota bacterium]